MNGKNYNRLPKLILTCNVASDSGSQAAAALPWSPPGAGRASVTGSEHSQSPGLGILGETWGKWELPGLLCLGQSGLAGVLVEGEGVTVKAEVIMVLT